MMHWLPQEIRDLGYHYSHLTENPLQLLGVVGEDHSNPSSGCLPSNPHLLVEELGLRNHLTGLVCERPDLLRRCCCCLRLHLRSPVVVEELPNFQVEPRVLLLQLLVVFHLRLIHH
jgi:hypothetical protein